MADTSLTSGDFLDEADPFALFGRWLQDATASEINDPNALALATVDEDGLPDVRMVLLKDFDSRGFVFYHEFRKRQGQTGPDVAESRDVLPLEVAAPAGADPRAGGGRLRCGGRRLFRIAAARAEPDRSLGLEAVAPDGEPVRAGKAVAVYAAKFGVGTIPRPPHWSGFRIVPTAIEFWHDRPFRLHDRLKFDRNGDGWTTAQL